MNMKQFEKDMSVFSFGQHQDTITYLDRLKTTDWSVEDARAWVKGKQEEIKQQLARQKLNIRSLRMIFKCPECQVPMRLLPLNFSPATLTGDDSKSVWLCSNDVCLHTIYNKKTVQEIHKELAEKK